MADSTRIVFQTAFDLAADHQLQIWDRLVIAVAIENRCRFLVSEDLQNGFTWVGLIVVDPHDAPVLFARALHDRDDLLERQLFDHGGIALLLG